MSRNAPASRDESAVAPSQTLRMASTAPAVSSSAAHEPRILACVMCQQRKTKCNRMFPCNSCTRLGVNCVPATLNPRRRRRRFAERELLDRVRHYETLLQQSKVPFESLFETVEAAEAGNPQRQCSQLQHQRRQQHEEAGQEQDEDEEEEASHDAASSLAALRQGDCDERMADAEAHTEADHDADTAGPASSSAPQISSDRGYEVKNFWKAIRKGFPDRSEFSVGSGVSGGSGGSGGRAASAASPASTSDTESDGPYIGTAYRELWARQLGNQSNLIFRRPPQHRRFANVAVLHPPPAQIFRLWQIYLENVDPLLKITHTASLQGRIVVAAARPDLEGIDPTLEALMFGIYSIAVHSMAPADCQAIFGSSKQYLLDIYQAACEQALLNSGFLRTSERECLAAFFLYLLSLGHGIDHRTLYSMLGTVMRVAQAMQIHIEFKTRGTAKLPPLEAEMRRRLWWALALFDARISELANHSPTMLDPTWDCCLPLNVNDLDFRPELKDPPSGAGGGGGGARGAFLSEALFAVVRSELGNAMRHMEYYLALSNPALKPMARDREYIATAGSARTTSPYGQPRRREHAELNALEDMIYNKYLQYCDPANGLHFMTIWIARGFVAKCRLIKYLSKFSQYAVHQPPQHPMPGVTPTSSSTPPSSETASASSSASAAAAAAAPATAAAPPLHEIALDDALVVIEADTNIMTSPLTRGYRWLVHLYFPLPAYIYITQELARRVGGERAKHAWAVMNNNYEARFALADSEDRYMFGMFASTILQAWGACEARMQAEGEPEPIEVPEMIRRIRSQLAATNDEEAATKGTATMATAMATATATETATTTMTTTGQVLDGTLDGTAVAPDSDNLGGFPTTLSIDMAQPSLFGNNLQPAGSGPPSASAFGDVASPSAVPLYPNTNLGGMGFGGVANIGNWPPMPMPWSWGPRPSWG
ncbi:MAG: hypothetical protein STHCBS139747_004860 [Sporothrix thermara]